MKATRELARLERRLARDQTAILNASDIEMLGRELRRALAGSFSGLPAHALDRSVDVIRGQALGAKCKEARRARGIRDMPVITGILHEAEGRVLRPQGRVVDMQHYLDEETGDIPEHLGVTYVAVEDRTIFGFATVAAAHVEIDDPPAALRRTLPRYPLPVLRLARLAVDQSAQGQGLGLQRLRFVLRLALHMADVTDASA